MRPILDMVAKHQFAGMWFKERLPLKISYLIQVGIVTDQSERYHQWNKTVAAVVDQVRQFCSLRRRQIVFEITSCVL